MANLIYKLRMKLFSIIYPFIDDISSYKNQFFRDYITKNTHGVILEIGSGNGANINYYKKYKKLILLDKNIHLLKKTQLLCNHNVILADSSHLPFKETIFDNIVSSLVLCSVIDKQKTIREMNRVLKPAGKYFFWEHSISKNKFIYHMKTYIIFIWKFLTGGCDYNSDNHKLIKSILWGKSKIYIKKSILVKFLGMTYIYGVVLKD